MFTIPFCIACSDPCDSALKSKLRYMSFDSIFVQLHYKAFNLFEYFLESFLTFLGFFFSIPRNPLKHSPETSWAFPGFSSNIPQNLFKHSPGPSWTFPGILWNIPRNVKIITFPGILAFPAFLAFCSPFLYSWFYK